MNRMERLQQIPGPRRHRLAPPVRRPDHRRPRQRRWPAGAANWARTSIPHSSASASMASRSRRKTSVYWLVNKPRGYLCTNHDPAGRPRAIDLVPHVQPARLHRRPARRGQRRAAAADQRRRPGPSLMHPRFGVEKTYLVQVAGRPSGRGHAEAAQGRLAQRRPCPRPPASSA